MEVYFCNQVVFDVGNVILCYVVIGLIGVVLYRGGYALSGMGVRGRCVWGGTESDGMYDVCCVEFDVPMWVGIDEGGGGLRRMKIYIRF